MPNQNERTSNAHKDNTELSFDEWFKELKRLAEKSGLDHIISDDEDDYKTTFYDDGFSPNDTLNEEVDASR